ncbi:aminopeptidase N-like [Musca vetustissima]|uniref:aminopeptidase N-like n=1 Tax=Musca vetustissima TaxID=27455 RepID=UPI002AB66149|nr:aminopeptidase N-like [Musca vetustissima]
MQSFVKILFVGLAAVLLLSAGSAEAGIRGVPPLYVETGNLENPLARLEERADVLNYRLPNDTVPVHYEVELTTNVHDGTRKFTGVVKIDITVVVPTTSLVLHARQLTIKSAKIKSATSASEDLNIDYEQQREFLTLTRKTNVNFPKDSKWIVTIEYEGQLRTDMGGFYLSTYTDEKGETRYLATTQFESTDARHGFPCYDEPSKRATFTIIINHSPTYNAICNMPVDEKASTSGRTVFQTTPIMPTYLLAFIISDFEYTEAVMSGIPQRIYSRPSGKHEQEFALVSGMLIVERLGEYLNVSYMLPKLDQAAIPDFAAGAMENWGLATYREVYMLYNKETSTVGSQTSIASIIAHELGHFWFGDYVAVRWWTYTWLKEGFATLLSYKTTDHAYPEWGVWQQFQTDDYQSALVNDANSSPRPMTHYVQTPAEIQRSYDYVSYAKAGCVLHMWNNALTDPVFRRGLYNYLDANKYSSAVEEQLFTAIQTAAKEENFVLPADIDTMMGSWSRQGGYPLLTVKRNYDDGSFTVSQTAYFNDEKLQSDKTWYVPFNYASKSKSDFRDTRATNYLMKVPSTEVKANLGKDEWLILNKQSTGFYRINYDEENWRLIAEGLRENPYRIHPRNRAQLMNDAYRFTLSNRLPHSVLLDLFTYLPNEDQYAPLSTVNGIINVYNRYLNGDARYSDFQNFLAEMIAPAYEKIGANDIDGEQHMQKFTRNSVINMACLAGVKSCLVDTNNKLKDLKEQGTPVEPNVKTQVFCHGLRQSEDDVFQYYFRTLEQSSDATFRRLLISSLGCSQNEKQLQFYLESSIDQSNQLRPAERTTILNPVYSRGSVGLMATFDFLDQYWNAYGNLNGGSGKPLDTALRGMSQYVVNAEQEKRLLALVDKVKGTAHATSNLESTVKTNIEANNNWLKVHRDPLMDWFQSYHAKSGSAAITGSSMAIGALMMVVISRLL